MTSINRDLYDVLVELGAQRESAAPAAESVFERNQLQSPVIKQNLAELRFELTTEFGGLKTEFAEQKSDFAELRADTRAQIAELDARWHEQLTRQPRWLARWVIFCPERTKGRLRRRH
jgi:hypothetical protein